MAYVVSERKLYQIFGYDELNIALLDSTHKLCTHFFVMEVSDQPTVRESRAGQGLHIAWCWLPNI